MSNEELMRPRYKVIADYPGNVQPIGHIHSVIGDMASTIYWCNEKDKYPHLFKRLEWWEERKPEEMPEYLKSLTYNFCYKKDDIIKVGKWIESFGPTLRFYSVRTDQITLHPSHYIPATLAEYEQYINQKEKQ